MSFNGNYQSENLMIQNDYYTTVYNKLANSNKNDLIKDVIYKGANVLAFLTVVLLICAGIYNVYQGLNKSVIVHPAKIKSKSC
mmetsp:Transcript_16897/g.19540  ORF Transcript_16897/g.19540 Transcript_16897/m.19540 type:complete len:83 (-) Transcript_16897:18-266(-)